MQIKWHLYPHACVITNEYVSRFPFVPNEWYPDHAVFYSLVWNANLQEYVAEYFNFIVSNVYPFEEIFNCSFDSRIEFVGEGDFIIDRLMFERFGSMRCSFHIHNCSS
jgi:hypothetical protein